MTIDRKTLAVVALGLALGWWLGSSPSSPVNPHPQPDRPVLRALARVGRTAARYGLWFALAADPPPAAKAKPEDQPRQQLVRAGADGAPRVDHSEGW
jgi:hypothetical protein